MTPKEMRDATKQRHDAYRTAARKHGTVRDHVQVCEAEGGAFVEVVVWISAEELAALAAERNPA